MISKFPIFFLTSSYMLLLIVFLVCSIVLFPCSSKSQWGASSVALSFATETGPFQKTFFFVLGDNSQVSSLNILERDFDTLKRNMEQQ